MQIMLIPQLYSHTGTYLTLCIDVLMYSYINRKSVLIPAYDLRTQVELTFTIPIIFNLNMEILIANMFLCIHSACQQQTINDIYKHYVYWKSPVWPLKFIFFLTSNSRPSIIRMFSDTCMLAELLKYIFNLSNSVFSQVFTDQSAHTTSRDHAPHLECNDCQYQTFAACVLLSTKHFSSVQCSLSSIFRAQMVFKFE